MARFEQHVAVSFALGVGCGIVAHTTFHLPWQEAAVATVFCTIGGVAPDLDSPQSRFAEFVLSTAALLACVFFLRYLQASLGEIHTVGLLLLLFWGVRWGLRQLLQHITVHRGMIHSLPACGIWTALVLLALQGNPLPTRVAIAAAAGIGFLSHLLLDELFAFVDASGMRLTPKRSLGSALKLWSASRRATASAYLLLVLLGWLCWRSF
jgi:hypothetical protein